MCLGMWQSIPSISVCAEPPTHYTYSSCSTMETHAVKLPVHNFCVDVNTRGDLELCSY